MTVGVEGRDIAGAEPAVVGEGGRGAFLVLVVFADHPRPAHQQFTEGLAVSGQVAAVVIDDLQVDTEKGATKSTFNTGDTIFIRTMDADGNTIEGLTVTITYNPGQGQPGAVLRQWTGL